MFITSPIRYIWPSAQLRDGNPILVPSVNNMGGGIIPLHDPGNSEPHPTAPAPDRCGVIATARDPQVQPEWNPDPGFTHGYVLILRLSRPLSGPTALDDRSTTFSILTNERTSVTQPPVYTWYGKERECRYTHGIRAIGIPLCTGEQDILVITPRGYSIRGLYLSTYGDNIDVTLDWMLYARLYSIIYPTPALWVQYARARKFKQTITGQTYVSEQSPNPIFKCRLRLNNEFRREAVRDLMNLDQIQDAVFGVIPCGLEYHLSQNSEFLWRKLGFVRNCRITRYTGFYGYQNSDELGATGIMEFTEVNTGGDAGPDYLLWDDTTTGRIPGVGDVPYLNLNSSGHLLLNNGVDGLLLNA